MSRIPVENFPVGPRPPHRFAKNYPLAEEEERRVQELELETSLGSAKRARPRAENF